MTTSTASEVNAKAAGTLAIGGDMPVNRLGYGAMRITGDGIWGEPNDRENAKKVLRRAVELGVNFIDTADSYGPAVSERLIGEALAPYAKGVVIATKAGLTRQGPNKWLPVGRPEYLTQQVEMSLRFLKKSASTCGSCIALIPRYPSKNRWARLTNSRARKDSPRRSQRGETARDRSGP